MSLIDHLSDTGKKLVDYTSFSLAGVAAVSLANAAMAMSFAAATASFVLACLRIVDWFKGRKAKDG